MSAGAGVSKKVAEALARRGYPAPAHPITDEEWAAYARGDYTLPLRGVDPDVVRVIRRGFVPDGFPIITGKEDFYQPSPEELEALLREPDA